MKSKLSSIVWFRYDLRTSDNPSLNKGAVFADCYPIYIYDTNAARPHGEASNLWLFHALSSLNQDLNGQLSFFKGNSKDVLIKLVKKYHISNVFFENTHHPDLNILDESIVSELAFLECKVHVSNSRTLWPIEAIKKSDETPYKVFTPFYKKGCLLSKLPDIPFTQYDKKKLRQFSESDVLTNVVPVTKKKWGKEVISCWNISEKGARVQWESFLKYGLGNYKDGRNFPSKPNVSRLSPFIHYGQISIRQLYHDAINQEKSKSTDHFVSELGWREFSYYLLHHFPNIQTQNFQEKFNEFPWEFNKKFYEAWCYGNTGYPIVDAGMRELYQTGYMHNRVRMICGSFLVKNLLIHWSYGEKWFWDCLFDADLASNVASWQWVAGTGADAAPYFRIFNPILQGKKFDPNGDYIKKYVPELSKLSNKHLNTPWETPTSELKLANVELGKNYPWPIIDYTKSRDRALAAFSELKKLS